MFVWPRKCTRRMAPVSYRCAFTRSNFSPRCRCSRLHARLSHAADSHRPLVVLLPAQASAVGLAPARRCRCGPRFPSVRALLPTVIALGGYHLPGPFGFHQLCTRSPLRRHCQRNDDQANFGMNSIRLDRKVRKSAGRRFEPCGWLQNSLKINRLRGRFPSGHRLLFGHLCQTPNLTFGCAKTQRVHATGEVTDAWLQYSHVSASDACPVIDVLRLK
jgi:hypothetical protein